MPKKNKLLLDAETVELASRMAKAEGKTPEEMVIYEFKFFLKTRGCPRASRGTGAGKPAKRARGFF